MKVTLSIPQSILTELITLLRFVENRAGITPYQAKRAGLFKEVLLEASAGEFGPAANPDTISRDPEPMPDSESEDVQKEKAAMMLKPLDELLASAENRQKRSEEMQKALAGFTRPKAGGYDSSQVHDRLKAHAEEMQKALASARTHDPLIRVWSAYDGKGKTVLSDSIEDFMKVSHTLVTSGIVRIIRRSEFDALQDYQPS